MTDGRSDSSSPRFDRSGKYLLFVASTDVGPGSGGGAMSAMGRSMTASVYAEVLRKTLLADRAGERRGAIGEGRKKDKSASAELRGSGGSAEKSGNGADSDVGDKPSEAKGEAWREDRERDGRSTSTGSTSASSRCRFRARTTSISSPARRGSSSCSALAFAADEDYLEQRESLRPPPSGASIRRSERPRSSVDKLDGPKSGLPSFVVSADGSKILYAKEKSWFLASADEPFKGDADPLKIGSVDVWVDPRAEWRQIFHEVWRIERDFLYDPHAHGLDLAAAEKLYAPFLDGIATRGELNSLLEEGLGNLVLGHVWASGGTSPSHDHEDVGLLGADYRVEEGRYRFAKILRGENWNPKLRAPLTAPGVDVKEGDFLLAVNGQRLVGSDDVHRLFPGRAGKQTVLTVSSSAGGTASRQVTVVPVESEEKLRLRTWMDENRQKVSDLSGGRSGLRVHPRHGRGGFHELQPVLLLRGGQRGDRPRRALQPRRADRRLHREHLAVEAGDGGGRARGGGHRCPVRRLLRAEGDDREPNVRIRRRRAPVALQECGDRDARRGSDLGRARWHRRLPAADRRGSVTAPRWGLFGTKGAWEIENLGVAPDVEVEQDPELVRQGHDPQLERAVQIALDGLAKNPPQKLKRPAYVDYGPRLPHPRDPKGDSTGAFG